MQTLKRSILVLLTLTFALVATGCGPSAEEVYFNNLNTAVTEYNDAMNEVAAQFEGRDASILTDQDWKDVTFAALDRLDAAGQVLASTPADQVPEKWVNLDNILVQVSEQTTVFTTTMKDALEAGDGDAMIASLDELQVVITLMQQAGDEINKVAP